jgi:hypothetical protein
MLSMMPPPPVSPRRDGNDTPEKKRRPGEEKEPPCQENNHRVGKLPRYSLSIPPPSPVLVPVLVRRIIEDFTLDERSSSLEEEDVFKLWREAACVEEEEGRDEVLF